MRKIAFAIPPAILLILIACGQAAPSGALPPAPTSAAQGTPAPTATAQPTEAPAPTQAPAKTAVTEAPATSSTPGAGTSVRPPDALVAAARQRLAKYLDVDEGTLALQSANQQEWPDGSLGCPEAGMAYPQIVTPGFVLVFSNKAQTKTYTIHTGRSEEDVILCENEQPIKLPGDASATPESATPPASDATNPASRPLVDLARQDLTKQLGIKAEDITVVSVEEVEWRDSSLGCPRPGMNYLQVITPGYRITLEAQGQRYEYHANQSNHVVRCDNPSK